MNLTSFFANKCFEYLLKSDADQEKGDSRAFAQQNSIVNTSSYLPIPPPWAVSSELFKKLCNGCGDCVSLCKNNILILQKNGYPYVDFAKGSCSFCGVCAQNCPQGALRQNADIHPWDLDFYITSKCLMQNRVVCNTCAEKCARGAIIFPRSINKDQRPRIISEICDGCGACFGSCPVGAISLILPTGPKPNR